jgi:hypothetical protein
MHNHLKSVIAIGLLMGLAACSPDHPHEYSHQRPDVDSLHPDDAGLQSKDLMAATDQMVRSLLAAPALRNSPTQWTLVIDRVEDRTLDRQFNTNYDIFLERLRVQIGKLGGGQVTLIENKQKVGDLRNRELDGEAPSAAPRTQPRYALYAKAMDMPNRSTNTYMLSFIVTNMQNGTQVWVDEYTVKVNR